jgi:hypothetical protein
MDCGCLQCGVGGPFGSPHLIAIIITIVIVVVVVAAAAVKI